MIYSSYTRWFPSSCWKPLFGLSCQASEYQLRALSSSPLRDPLDGKSSQLLLPPLMPRSKLHTSCIQSLHSTTSLLASRLPRSKDRGPASKELTQTDFASLDVLGRTPAPTTAIEACHSDGFLLNSGLRVSGSGALLIGGEAFTWRPWEAIGGKKEKRKVKKLLNSKGQWNVPPEVWGLLDIVWPKPG
jgi:NADH dehydrogenase [ubiquinone] 1 alpha subcomplex assembly factor 3